MIILEIFKAIILGIVQGVTEWLPISSTGHLLIAEEFFRLNVTPEFRDLFIVVIQLGSILAVLTLFFHKLNPFSPKKDEAQKQHTFALWGRVLVAAVPAAIAGFLLDDWIERLYQSDPLIKITVIAGALIFYGVLFIVIEAKPRNSRINTLAELDYKAAFGIGVFQILALVPGTSRSGSTILGATLLGTSRMVAAEFSFFLAIPMMFGASGLKLVKFFAKGMSFSASELVILLVGTLIAFLVSIWAIKFLINYLKRNDFKAFGYYRIGFGLFILVYFLLIR